MNLINTHPFGGFKAGGLLELVNVVAKDIANTAFSNANFLCNTGKSALIACLPIQLTRRDVIKWCASNSGKTS
ncbi:hypothetical protein [Polynucleobacter sp. AM-25C3]|uniref:hypothetical protein n=1 Tax=Polynucleobacter sp. AM-25C3 TaxID=1855569 RepID=UPI002105312E|nr:hypothetical protein [Polynucleobacter sp. AM-25C3]